MTVAMRSLRDIICMVVDGEINTRAEADAILAEETDENRAQLRLSMDAALDRICTPRTSQKLRELFDEEN